MSPTMTHMSHVSYNDTHDSCLLYALTHLSFLCMQRPKSREAFNITVGKNRRVSLTETFTGGDSPVRSYLNHVRIPSVWAAELKQLARVYLEQALDEHAAAAAVAGRRLADVAEGENEGWAQEDEAQEARSTTPAQVFALPEEDDDEMLLQVPPHETHETHETHEMLLQVPPHETHETHETHEMLLQVPPLHHGEAGRAQRESAGSFDDGFHGGNGSYEVGEAEHGEAGIVLSSGVPVLVGLFSHVFDLSFLTTSL
jgi:hypothetical protein